MNARWLTQPTSLTFLKGEMTLNQVNTMIELVDVLQDKISTALSTKQTSIFTDEDFDAKEQVVIPIQFSAMTTDPRRYKYFEDVARSLAETSITTERIDKDGKPYTSIKPLIAEARIPKSSGGYRNTMELVIDKDMIDSVFNIIPYNRYLKQVARNTESVYTSRIYMFISAYRKLGTWKPKYEDLHMIFGFSRYVEDKETKTKVWTPSKYPVYRQFKQKILNVAQKELRELADNGWTDCYFDFVEEYPIGKKSGKPERIIFYIHSTELGEQLQSQGEVNAKLVNLEAILRKEFRCSPTDIKQTMKLVDADNIDFAMLKIEDARKHLDGIENKPAYIIATLRNALQDLIPQAETVTTEQSEPEEGRAEAPVAGTAKEPSASEQKLFKSVLQEKTEKMWHSAFSLKSVSDDTVIIGVPNEGNLKFFREKEGDGFFEALKEAFSKNISFVFEV